MPSVIKSVVRNVSKVHFDYLDGKTVGNGPGGCFVLRSPLQVRLKKGESVHLLLGLSCDHSLLLFAGPGLRRDNIELTGGIRPVDADSQIEVHLTNFSDGEVEFPAGYPIIHAFPLLSREIE